MINVVVAGATGWAGGALARGVAAQSDLKLAAAVSRKGAGKSLRDASGGAIDSDAPVHAGVGAALDALARAGTPCNVLVEYTKPDVAKANVLAALAAGAHVVVGTSGLSDADYADIDAAARAAGRGVLACGNFAITVVLLQRFAEMAMRYIPNVELIDYAKAGKVDAPSGTVRELANRLGKLQPAAPAVAIDAVKGPRETRGATMSGVQVHAVRLPGYVIGVEAVFGLPDQRLHLKHESGASAEPYVQGALLAIRKVGGLTGVVRGLDRVMEW